MPMRLQGVCSLKFHESYAMQSNLPCPSAVGDTDGCPRGIHVMRTGALLPLQLVRQA